MISAAKRGPHWSATLGASIFGFLFLTNWPTYHYSILGGPVPLLYYMIPALAIPFLLAARPNALHFAIRDPVVIWFAIFVVSGLMWLIATGEFMEEETRQWRLRMLSFLSLIAALVLGQYANRVWIVRVTVACALLASIANWYDFLFPFNFVERGDELSTPGRGAGMFINANFAGGTIIAMIIAVLPFISMPKRALLLLVMVLGVIPTFSRSAIVFAVLAILLVYALRQVSRRQLRIAALGVLVLFPLVLGLHRYATEAGEIDVQNVQSRIEFFVSIGQALDESAIERQQIAGIAWGMFADNPLLGKGLGASTVATSVGTHNMYLALLAEQGLLGGILYLALVIIVLTRGYLLFTRHKSRESRDIGAALLLMATYFGFMGLFTHNILERTNSLFLLAFLLAMATQSERLTRPRPSAVDRHESSPDTLLSS